MISQRKNEEAMLPIMQAMQCFTSWCHHSLSSKLETRRQDRKQGDPEQGDPPFGLKPGRKLVECERSPCTVLHTYVHNNTIRTVPSRSYRIYEVATSDTDTGTGTHSPLGGGLYRVVAHSQHGAPS